MFLLLVLPSLRLLSSLFFDWSKARRLTKFRVMSIALIVSSHLISKSSEALSLILNVPQFGEAGDFGPVVADHEVQMHHVSVLSSWKQLSSVVGHVLLPFELAFVISGNIPNTFLRRCPRESSTKVIAKSKLLCRTVQSIHSLALVGPAQFQTISVPKPDLLCLNHVKQRNEGRSFLPSTF